MEPECETTTLETQRPPAPVTAGCKQNRRPHHETNNNQQHCSALPLPARQSAFLAYFLFGQKKVGRAGGAKAFDFDFVFDVDFDFDVVFEFEFEYLKN
ncbi:MULTISPECIES: hypothetical protein [Cupriavidus]